MEYEVEFTHYGWFGLCPVIFAGIESGEPFIEPRFEFLRFLFVFSEFLIESYLNLRCAMNPEFEPMLPIVVSGELDRKIIITTRDE